MSKRKGFTLIELLVVISIIALLLAILMPSLNAVKKKASSAVCLMNTRSLSMGWFMYQDDNNGNIMCSTADARASDGTMVGWSGRPRDENGTILNITQKTPPVTDEDEIRGIKVGVLHEYLDAPKSYHCPGDNIRRSKYDGTKVFVTYAIAGCLNRDEKANGKFQIKKFGEIRRPSTKYVFIETAENRNWNMGMRFVMAAPEFTNSPKWGWWGPLAINHGDSSVLGYSDGHSEVRKWRDEFTIEHLNRIINNPVDSYGHAFPPDNQQSDIEYMSAGWAFRYGL